MKKGEIAANVFEVMDAEPLAELAGGELVVPVADLAGLSLVPWFCDASVQWGFRLSAPDRKLPKSLLKKVNDSYITATESGAVLIGVPGDGIEPSTYTLFPLAAAIAAVVEPGMRLEFAAANLGIVKRDWEVEAETSSRCGNQHYAGTVDDHRNWVIQRSTPALSVQALETALGCGRMVAENGPWPVKDRGDAFDLVMTWIQSPQANINPMAVGRFVSVRDGAFVNSDAGMVRKLCGLGLAYFRRRLPDGPYQWSDPGVSRHSVQQLEQVAHAIAG
jgi:hypothetical protein